MSLTLSNPAPAIRIVDVIPRTASAETDQNAESSLAVDPLDPYDIIAGVFSRSSTPYFLSTNGGVTWSNYGSLNTSDKSLAWSADGTTALTVTLTSTINLYAGTTSSGNFGSPIFTFSGILDQPWIRTGSSGHVYITYNDLGPSNGESASVLVGTESPSGAFSFTPVQLEHVVPLGGQDAPSVRTAVNGDTVYAAFTRWTSPPKTDSAGNDYYNADVIVTKSINDGADGFSALGNGVSVLPTNSSGQTIPITSVFSNRDNSLITLGQERTGGDLAIAVDPNNAQHVVIAYGSAGPIGSGQLQLVVAESQDGGTAWQTEFTTPIAIRAANPALAIAGDGTIGFLYAGYDPATNQLSQHFVTTTDDFTTTTDSTLAVETNASPKIQYEPYLGDFFDLTCVGNTFYGTFCASNADNGTGALFNNLSFLRNYTGTPGTSSFTLTNLSGSAVSPSIDPFFFTFGGLTVTAVNAAPNTGYYGVGESITIAVTFSDNATIIGTAPTLTLNDGGVANYQSGSGTNTLTFDYTVGASDSNVANLAVTGINLPAGTLVQDASGNDAVFLALPTTFSGLQVDTVNIWKNTAGGDWSTAINWSPAAVPDAGNTALITTSGTYTITVTQPQAVSIAILQMQRSATLAIAANETFDVTGGTGTGVLAGTITVADAAALGLGSDAINTTFNRSGKIALAAGNDATSLTIAGGVTLSGTSKINLLGANDEIISDGNLASLTNGNASFGSTIAGAGTIGDANLSFINGAKGIINANGAGGTAALTIATASFSNAGILEASGLGVLMLDDNITNLTTGQVKTLAAGSHIYLNDATISGGMLSTVAGSSVDSVGGSSEISTTTTLVNAGRLGAENGDLIITGTVKNTGTLDANGHLLDIGGPVTGTGKATISGDGTLEFGAAATGITQNVTFTNTGSGMETLKFDATASSTATLIYGGTIFGFSNPSDVIDFTGLPFQPAASNLSAKLVSGNTVVTVTEGADVVSFKLAGNHLLDSFTVTQDSGSGTEIFDPPGPTPSAAIGGPDHDHFIFPPGLGDLSIGDFNAKQDVNEFNHHADAQTVHEVQVLLTPELHDLGHDGMSSAETSNAHLAQVVQAGHFILH